MDAALDKMSKLVFVLELQITKLLTSFLVAIVSGLLEDHR